MSRPLHLRFLRRAQRRWMLWRILECAGIAAAIGAAFALILVGLLTWRGEPALHVAIVLPAVAAGVGMVWGIHRKPTLTQTAILTDQQLKLHDLLSTALLAEGSADQAFCSTIFAQAQAICISRSPNELVVRRLDARAWSGIGILSAMVLVIALMSNEAGVRVAQAQTESQNSRPAWIDSLNAGVNQSPRTNGESGTPSSRANLNQRDKSTQNSPAGLAKDREDNSQTSDAHSNGPGDSRQVKVDAMGENEGRTVGINVPDIANPNATASESAPDGTISAGGSKTGSAVNPNDAQQSSDKRAGTNSSAIAPQWQSADTHPNQLQNDHPIRVDSIPDRYRDLVREYFSRQN